MNSPRIPVYRLTNPMLPVGQPGYGNSPAGYPQMPPTALPPHPQPPSPGSYGVLFTAPQQGCNMPEYSQYQNSQQQYPSYSPQQNMPMSQTSPPSYIPPTSHSHAFRPNTPPTHYIPSATPPTPYVPSTTPPVNSVQGQHIQYRSNVTPPMGSSNYLIPVVSKALSMLVAGVQQNIMSQSNTMDTKYSSSSSYSQSQYIPNKEPTTLQHFPTGQTSVQPSQMTSSHIQNQSYLGVYSDDQAMFMKGTDEKVSGDLPVSTAEDIFKAKASKCGIEITTKREHRQKVSEKLEENAKIRKKINEKLSEINADIFKQKASLNGIQIEKPKQENIEMQRTMNDYIENTQKCYIADLSAECVSESSDQFSIPNTEDESNAIARDEFGAVEIMEPTTDYDSSNKNKELFRLLASHHGITIQSPSPKKPKNILSQVEKDKRHEPAIDSPSPKIPKNIFPQVDKDEGEESAIENLNSQDSVTAAEDSLLLEESGILCNQVLLAVSGSYRSPTVNTTHRKKVQGIERTSDDENLDEIDLEVDLEKMAKKIVSNCIMGAVKQLVSEGYFTDSALKRKPLYSWGCSQEDQQNDSVSIDKNLNANEGSEEESSTVNGDSDSALELKLQEINSFSKDPGKNQNMTEPVQKLFDLDKEKHELKPKDKISGSKNDDVISRIGIGTDNPFMELNPSVPEFFPNKDGDNFNNNQENDFPSEESLNAPQIESKSLDLERIKNNSLQQLNPSSPEFRPTGNKGIVSDESESLFEFVLGKTNMSQSLNPSVDEFGLQNVGENSSENDIERSRSNSLYGLDPSSPEFKPNGLKYMMKHNANNEESSYVPSMRAEAPIFQPTIHVKPHSMKVKMQQSSTQTETLVTFDKSNNTRRIKQTNQHTETQSCDMREVCINTVETFNDESSDYYVPPPEVVSCGIMTEPVASRDVGVMYKVKKENKSCLTDENNDLYKLLRNTQRELLHLRFQLCMEEIQRNIDDLQKNKDHWVKIFSAVSERKCLEEIIDSRITSLKIETNILQSKLLMYEDQLNEGQVWQQVPSFNISLPIGPCDIKVLNKQEKLQNPNQEQQSLTQEASSTRLNSLPVRGANPMGIRSPRKRALDGTVPKINHYSGTTEINPKSFTSDTNSTVPNFDFVKNVSDNFVFGDKSSNVKKEYEMTRALIDTSFQGITGKRRQSTEEDKEVAAYLQTASGGIDHIARENHKNKNSLDQLCEISISDGPKRNVSKMSPDKKSILLESSDDLEMKCGKNSNTSSSDFASHNTIHGRELIHDSNVTHPVMPISDSAISSQPVTEPSFSVKLFKETLSSVVSSSVSVTVSSSLPLTVSSSLPVTVSSSLPVAVSSTLPVIVSSMPVTVSSGPVTVSSVLPSSVSSALTGTVSDSASVPITVSSVLLGNGSSIISRTLSSTVPIPDTLSSTVPVTVSSVLPGTVLSAASENISSIVSTSISSTASGTISSAIHGSVSSIPQGTLSSAVSGMVSSLSTGLVTSLGQTLSANLQAPRLQGQSISCTTLPARTSLPTTITYPGANQRSTAPSNTIPVMPASNPVFVPGPLLSGPRMMCPLPQSGHVQVPVGGVVIPGQVLVRSQPQVLTPVIQTPFHASGLPLQGQLPQNIQMMPRSQANIPTAPVQLPFPPSNAPEPHVVSPSASIQSQIPNLNSSVQLPSQNVDNLSKSGLQEKVDPALYEAVVTQLKQAYPEMAKNPDMLKAVAHQQTAVLQYYVSQGNNPLESKSSVTVDSGKKVDTLSDSSPSSPSKNVTSCAGARKAKSPVSFAGAAADVDEISMDDELNDDKPVKAPPGFTKRPDSLPNFNETNQVKPKKEPFKPRNFLDDFTPSKSLSASKAETCSTSLGIVNSEITNPVPSKNQFYASTLVPEKSKSLHDATGNEIRKRERTISGSSSGSSRSATPPPNVLSNFKKLPSRLQKKIYSDHLSCIQSDLTEKPKTTVSDENWDDEVDPYAAAFVLGSKPKKELENQSAQSPWRPVGLSQPPSSISGMQKLQRVVPSVGENAKQSLGKSSELDLIDDVKVAKSCELVVSWLNKQDQGDEAWLDSPRSESSSKKFSYAQQAAKGIPKVNDTELDVGKALLPDPPVEEKFGDITDIPMPKVTGDEDRKTEDGSDGESWQQVTKKKKKPETTGSQQGMQVLPLTRKKNKSGDTSMKSADAAQKSSNFERLVAKLSEVFTGLDRSDVIELIQDVRTVRGGLSGLTLKQIVDVARTVVSSKSKTSSRRKVKNTTPSPPASGPSPISPPTSSNGPTSSGFTPPFLRKVYDLNNSNMRNSFSDDDEEICVICHDGLSVYETKTLECQHVFHTRCIKEWVLGRERTCPTCRRHALFPEEFPKLGK